MEGMPRVPMFTPDLKLCAVSLPADFATQIKEYILIHYQDDPTKYDSAIGEIENMRSKLGRLLPDVETLKILKRYYAQLCLMKNRFPMEEGDAVRVPFSWMDKSMDVPSATVNEDINYELACVMYSIGAVHGAIAANELRTELDSIKNAFTHFQCAAFPFQQIRDSMNAVKYSPIDFDPSLLTFYVNILLAQAQECLLEKGIVDHRKNTVIAKLAVHLRDVYKQCREHLDVSGLSDIIPSSKYKEYLKTCDVKTEMYGAIAMLHLGCQAEDEGSMGLRLAYFEFALEHISVAMKLVEKDKRKNLKESVTFLNDIIVAKQTNAKKENDFIYHDRVPKPEELRLVEGVVMVKAVGFDPTDRSVAGSDLFAALLPGNVLKSLSVYSEEKAKFKRAILEKVAEKDKELEEYIKSLQLEELNIDDDSKAEELPEMLLERSAAFNSQPDAFPELLDKLHRVGGCAIEADHKISDLRNRMDAINSLQLKNDEGFVAITKELSRINDHHMKARTNNAELQRALAAHSENLKVLAMPLNELSRRLADTRTRPADSLEGQLLKKMLNKTNEMSEQRRALLLKLSEALQNDDITAKCLAEKNEDNQELYEKELKKHEETAKLIDLNLAAQQNILNALTDANASFGDYRKKIIEENKGRMDQVLALTAAYDVYVDVSQKAEEGLKFYSTLFSLLRGLDEAVEAIENAFEEEKKEREKEMLRGLEERANGANWITTANGTQKDRQADISVDAENFGNENAQEQGSKGLRLKDCLEYYRTKIAKPQMPQASNMPHETYKNHIMPNQISSTPSSPQLSGCQSSLPLQPHSTPIYRHSIPNPELNTDTRGVHQFVSSNMATPSPVPSLQGPNLVDAAGSGHLGFRPQLNVMLPASQSFGVQRPQIPTNQFTAVYQNSGAIRPSFSVIDSAQQVVTSVPPQLSNISGNFQTGLAAATSGQTAVVPENIALANRLPAPALPTQSPRQTSLTQSMASLNMTEFGPAGTVPLPAHGSTASLHVQPKTHSPFAPIRMCSDFAQNLVPASTPALARPAVVPAHNLICPQSTSGQVPVSPWHQPLANINNSAAQTADPRTGAIYAGGILPGSRGAPPCHPLTAGNIASPAEAVPTPPMDIMNAPLDATLPPPLAPTHLKNSENENSTSNVQLITAHSELSTESARTEEVHLTQTPKSSESVQPMTEASLGSVSVQSLRPAAAVAPIMQTDCCAASTTDSTLCITNVTSMSYAAPPPQPKTTVPCIIPHAEGGNNSTEERSNNVREVMNPQTFTIGAADPVRLQKRRMREQFKTEGVAAQLPPLDPADPINCIDAHYWLNK